MNEKNSLIYILINDLFVKLLLTLISSINWIFLLISLIIYFCLILKEKTDYEKYSIDYISSIIYILFHYILFTLSYAEILPWETAIVFVLIILIIYYYRKLCLITNKSYIYCLPFGKSKEEFDINVNVLMIKYLLTNIFLYIYILHLCLTTICTPDMYFNWFLIIKNCRYTYSSLHSSYTLSGGIIGSFPWIMISSYYLFHYLFR
ncbi:unnamed protein product [Rotaria sordida]|uniref:Uncharacterized protein n=1 Tax=Rotaria sordida TaxID=392033 RepID=A0A815EJG1_9BILA|nr:unnamed protein product [Rotaria sordida]